MQINIEDKDQIKRRAYDLVSYISKEINVPIRLVFTNPPKNDPDTEGQCICSRELILVYNHEYIMNNWYKLREIICHESSHRFDCSRRGYMHHNPKYEHDRCFWQCYRNVMDIARDSPFW